MKWTELFAAYGAALSTVTFMWTVARSRPRVKVDLLYGVQRDVSGVHVSVRNRSAHPVRLVAISFMYQWKKQSVRDRLIASLRYRRLSRWQGWVHWGLHLRDIDDGCPVTVAPHDAFHLIVPDDLVEELIAKSACGAIVAVVQDALWNNSYSDRYTGVGAVQAAKVKLWNSK